MNVLIRCRGEKLLHEFCPDSFRCNDTIQACCHGQDDCEFFAAVTTSEIRLTQASFYDLAESYQDLVPLDMAVCVVECLEIVEIQQQEG